MMFADTTPDPRFFWDLVLSIGFMVTIGANVATMLAMRRTQKREVRWEFEPAAKKEFDKHVERNLAEHENIFSKLSGIERGAQTRMDGLSVEWRRFVESKLSELLASNDSGREKLHDRINEILQEVSELRGEMRANARGDKR
jgi:hypothetical protein